jgi:hypothetical protein
VYTPGGCECGEDVCHDGVCDGAELPFGGWLEDCELILAKGFLRGWVSHGYSPF